MSLVLYLYTSYIAKFSIFYLFRYLVVEKKVIVTKEIILPLLPEKYIDHHKITFSVHFICFLRIR